MRAPWLWLVLVTVAAPGTAAPQADRPADPAARALQREVAQMRRERELSAGKGFYLRLDAERQRLGLMLQGGLELGVPEVLFADRRPRSDWDLEPISSGRLEPERQRDRVELIAPTPTVEARAAESASPQPSPSPPAMPKSAEEAYSVPSPYRIVFAEGVSLEVRSRGEGQRNRSLLRRVADAASLRLDDLGSALGLGSKDRIRLRLTLDAEDAASLYRSLPPDVGLIVVGLEAR
jgi:pyruvate/2-oxoglutarate dehydrogenase complex dihydrolipoamide acyltransferase (E2) component